MAQAKFGKKRICGNCSTKFYDMLKQPPIKCPHCSEEIDIVSFNYMNDYKNLTDTVQKNSTKKIDEFATKDEDLGENLDQENDEIISLEEVDKEDQIS